MITKGRLVFAATAASALVLTGCSQDAGSDEPAAEGASDSSTAEGSATEGGGATATLAMEGQSFTFAPTVCMLQGSEVLVSGPGADDDSGEPAFLDVDYYDASEVSGGGVRIDLGTDQQFQSSDDFYSMGSGSGGGSIEAQGRQLTIAADVLDGGETSLGAGTLRVSC